MAGHRNLRKMEALIRLSLRSPLLTSSHRARKLENTSRNSLKYIDIITEDLQSFLVLLKQTINGQFKRISENPRFSRAATIY